MTEEEKMLTQLRKLREKARRILRDELDLYDEDRVKGGDQIVYSAAARRVLDPSRRRFWSCYWAKTGSDRLPCPDGAGHLLFSLSGQTFLSLLSAPPNNSRMPSARSPATTAAC